MHSYDWDDIKYILAVVDQGSVSAAARALKVNHATVLRRIALFEERFGIHMFDRSLRGYVLPVENRQLIETMRDVETAALSVERQIAGEGDSLRGHVRITSTDTFCHRVLAPMVSNLKARFPDLVLELMCTNAHLDLSRMEADITVRPALVLADHLEGEHAGMLEMGGFSRSDAPNIWIGLSGALKNSAAAKWMDDNVSPDLIGVEVDSFLTALELVKSGMGRAILPCILSEESSGLDLLDIDPVVTSVPIWIASHRELSQIPRIAAVRAELANLFREDEAL